METTTFTKAGKQYDLSLDFGILREVERIDFSAIGGLPSLLELDHGEGLFELLYTNSKLIACAVGILWVKSCKQGSQSEYAAFENSFLEGLLGNDIENIRKALRGALANFSSALIPDLEVFQAWETATRTEKQAQSETRTELAKQVGRKQLQEQLAQAQAVVG